MKDRLEKTKDIAQIISWVAIPTMIAVFGWNIESSIKEDEIRRDYVQLSLQILRDPPRDETHDLRAWARDVLAAYSPVPFTERQKAQLEKLSPPPSSVMVPPQTENRLRQLLFAAVQARKEP